MAILAGEHTRVIVQGITGREATSFTKDMIDYGTKVVAGVTPGKGGQRVHGIPVYDTVRQALRHHPAEASVISVPPALVKGAVLEAIENGITLAVVVSERVPRKDTIEFLEVAKARNARVIGPNTLGLISPGKVRLGMAGGPAADVRKAYMPGPVGIASRSGGMTTEIANLLTTRGIGQSTCIGIGGDPIIGTTFVDALGLFEKDNQTKVVLMIGEIGGSAEEDAALFIREKMTKPVVAFITGKNAPPGKRMGHAGAIISGGKGTAAEKIKALKAGGVVIADSPSSLGATVAEVMKKHSL